MTRDPAGLEDFLSEPAGQRVKDAGGIHSSINDRVWASELLGGPRYRIFQGSDARASIGTSRTSTQVPNLGHHNFLSMKRLPQSFDPPMRVYPAAAVIRLRSGGESLRSEDGCL